MYLKGLNDKQKEAVLTTQGPVLILAGAGSGKTRVITNKIGYLMGEKKVSPYEILAITFTNKAANEMKERVEALTDSSIGHMWIGTFHSIGVRILRRSIDRLDYDRNFSIYDRSDQKTLVKEVLEELNLDNKIYNENYILTIISSLKNDMVDSESYIKDHYNSLRERNIGEVYKRYEEKLKENNALDFDDLLIKPVELFLENPDLLKSYQEQFNYIFVDEYQDTNRIQYQLIKLLAGKKQNISVVGDSDQSIYSWRGADIRNILDFEKDYKDAKLIVLEENYRSSQAILSLANNLIKNNEERQEKNLFTSLGEGLKPTYIRLDDERREGSYIAEEINKIKDQYSLSNIGILYRTNAQSRPLEEAFMANGIAYRLVGGTRFYDRKEIKDILAYLRLIVNPKDDLSLSRIINVPKRGIGASTLSKLEDFARGQNISLYQALKEAHLIDLSQGAKNRLVEFYRMIEDLRSKEGELALEEFIEYVIDRSGYKDFLQASNTIEDRARLENIEELVSSAIDFKMSSGSDSLEEYLANISLISDIDSLKEGEEGVTLMTFHSAKGLEYDVIFMVGMEDGLFPSKRSVEEGGLEEERRLCYVGITRAKKKLYLTSAKYRTIYGRTSSNIESRFIGEMGDYIDKEYDSAFKIVDRRSQDTTKISRNTRLGFGTRPIYEKSKSEKNKQSFKLGDKVIHKKWGLGTVVQVSDRSGDQELNIAFESQGLKRLLASLAPIELKE